MFLYGSRYLGDAVRPIGVKVCVQERASALLMAISLGVTKCGVKEELGWTIFGLSDTDFCHLTANVSKTVSRNVTRQLELNIRSTRAFYKCKSRGGSPPPSRVHYKDVAFLV